MQSSSLVRLTQQVKAGGCASKLAPGSLRAVLDKLPSQNDPNLLVGFDTSDDAGVYRMDSCTALVQTVDFFTPIVDDPYTFGQIAAANALSDVYAMGGRPLTALAVVCFPQDGDLDVLRQIMRGGLNKMSEATDGRRSAACLSATALFAANFQPPAFQHIGVLSMIASSNSGNGTTASPKRRSPTASSSPTWAGTSGAARISIA